MTDELKNSADSRIKDRNLGDEWAEWAGDILQM